MSALPGGARDLRFRGLLHCGGEEEHGGAQDVEQGDGAEHDRGGQGLPQQRVRREGDQGHQHRGQPDDEHVEPAQQRRLPAPLQLVVADPGHFGDVRVLPHVELEDADAGEDLVGQADARVRVLELLLDARVGERTGLLLRGGGGTNLDNANRNERSWGRSLLHGHGTFSTSKVDGWRLAVGGGWRLAVGGGWWLAGVGAWRLAVGCGWWRLAACWIVVGKRFVTPTETNVHGDALCFMVMGPSLLRRLAVGGQRLVVPGGCPSGLSLTKDKTGFVRTALRAAGAWAGGGVFWGVWGGLVHKSWRP